MTTMYMVVKIDAAPTLVNFNEFLIFEHQSADIRSFHMHETNVAAGPLIDFSSSYCASNLLLDIISDRPINRNGLLNGQ